MPKYILVMKQSRIERVLPSWRRLVETVHENNTHVSIDQVRAGAVMAVTCENQPRDLPEYGLVWERVSE